MITVNLYYKGKNGSAKAFMEEMESSGTAEKIRAEKGNLEYKYYYSAEDPETVLLIDSWTDQAAIDEHHKSPMMAAITELREKYDLTMTMKRFTEDNNDSDLKYIRTGSDSKSESSDSKNNLNKNADSSAYVSDEMSTSEIESGVMMVILSGIMIPIVFINGEFFLTSFPGFVFTGLISLFSITALGFLAAIAVNRFSKRNVTKEVLLITSIFVMLVSGLFGLISLNAHYHEILGDLEAFLIWCFITLPAFLCAVGDAIILVISVIFKKKKTKNNQ